jgi:predicted acyl esterase
MISFAYFPEMQRAASRAVLAAALLLGPSTAVLAQGASGAAPAPPSAPARTSAGPIPVPPAPTGVMGAGTGGRMWADPPAPLAPKPATPPYKIKITEDVKIAMRDGVKLDAVVYVPERRRPAGCILVFDGYGRTFDPRDRRFAEEQGYAVVNVSTRGIFKSEGKAGLYDDMANDGYDTVEWMAKQPWCADGNVGAFGSSLPGIPLWQIANTFPPHLKAIAPDVSCADCYNYLWYPGGTLPGPGREDRGDHEYLAAIQHRDRDAWWDKQIVDDTEIAAIAKSGIGVMVSGGLQDYITPGNMAAFSTLQQAGGKTRMLIEGTAHFGARRSILGPWHHETHMDLFFAHYLRGEKNAWSDGKTYKGDVLLWIMGPNKFRWEKAWPLPDTRYAKLYLRAKPSGSIKPPPRRGGQSDDPNAGASQVKDGSLSAAPPSADEAATVYRYFPESGPFLPAARTSNDGWPKIDEAPFETATASWTTEPLAAPTEVTGNIVFDFSASSTAADTDFVLMVTDVGPDGKSQYVSSGVLNAPRYPDASKPNPLKPGEVRTYKIVAQPMAYVFQPGHRVRFSVAGGVTPAPGQAAAQGPGKNASYAQVTIFQNAERPASVTIPIIGTGQLTSEAASAR